MRIIILAAGQGTRLRPLTNNRPKCMVELENKPLIEYQLDVFEKFNVTDINVVTGYLEDKIDFPNVKKYYNPKYDKTNMVSTLFCAKELFDGEDDIIISYGDIIFNETVFQQLADAKDEVNIVVDKNWKAYWSARMDDPLRDAETLKIRDNKIVELGKKPTSYDDIEAQYIGFVKIRKDKALKIKEFYENLDKSKIYDTQDYDNMYMTSFLQMIADNLLPLTPVYIENGWMEVDEVADLDINLYNSFLKKV
jgi:choline kinase